MKNQHAAGSQVVLFKIAGRGADQPGLDLATFQVQSQVVLYKHLRSPPRVPPSLKLAVALDRVSMRLPVIGLIAGMSFAPFTPAVADDLGVFGIGDDFAAMIFGAAPSLTLRLAADALVGAELRRLERLLAELAATAAARQGGIPPDRVGNRIPEEIRYRVWL